MTLKSEAEHLSDIKRHTTANRGEIEASEGAECVSCCAMFDAAEVQDWQEERAAPGSATTATQWSAKCPRCGQPTVIGTCTGLLEDQSYVPLMNGLLEKHGLLKRLGR